MAKQKKYEVKRDLVLKAKHFLFLGMHLTKAFTPKYTRASNTFVKNYKSPNTAPIAASSRMGV